MCMEQLHIRRLSGGSEGCLHDSQHRRGLDRPDVADCSDNGCDVKVFFTEAARARVLEQLPKLLQNMQTCHATAIAAAHKIPSH